VIGDVIIGEHSQLDIRAERLQGRVEIRSAVTSTASFGQITYCQGTAYTYRTGRLTIRIGTAALAVRGTFVSAVDAGR
jgi:hypothetical protein